MSRSSNLNWAFEELWDRPSWSIPKHCHTMFSSPATHTATHSETTSPSQRKEWNKRARKTHQSPSKGQCIHELPWDNTYQKTAAPSSERSPLLTERLTSQWRFTFHIQINLHVRTALLYGLYELGSCLCRCKLQLQLLSLSWFFMCPDKKHLTLSESEVCVVTIATFRFWYQVLNFNANTFRKKKVAVIWASGTRHL